MKRRFQHISILLHLWMVFGLLACSGDEIASDSNTPQGEQATVALLLQPQGYASLNGNIRVLAFNAADKLVKEFPSVSSSAVGQTQMITLPIGQNKIILLGNANPLLGIDPLASALIVGVTSYSDVMFQLGTIGGLLNDPTQYFYGNDTFDLQPGPMQTRTIILKNLTSKARISYTNGFANLFDSAHVWIENCGKTINFKGLTTSVGTTRKHTYIKGIDGMLKADSFLVFPSISSIPTVMKAKFYLNNGHTMDFSKTLAHTFIPNKILQFIFDLDGLQANINLSFSILDWATPNNNQSISGNMVMTMTGGVPTNYTYADISLTYHFSDSYSYPIDFHQVAVHSVNGQLQILAPLNNMELGSYTLENIQLYDAEGSFAALSAPVNFQIHLNDNSVAANIFGRSAYEQSLLKKWLLVIDGQSGSNYPGTTIVNQINNNPSYNPFNDAASLGLNIQNLNGENRLTGLNLSGRSLSTLNVPAYAANFTKLSTLNVANNQLTNVNLSSLPYLQTVNLAQNLTQNINIAGCKLLTTFDTNFTSADRTALKTLNCSQTGITQLSPLFSELTSLNWSNCGLTDNQVSGVSMYHKLVTLNLASNKLMVYPDFAALVALGVLQSYSVQYNDIVSCALNYMYPFGEDNILNQRTGFNFWCP